MTSMFANEMRCLSNAVTQSCMRARLLASQSVPPLVRSMVEEHKIEVQKIALVALHQCPHEDDHVEYDIHLRLTDGRCFHKEFQGAGRDVAHDTYVLYDRRRDGECQHLHLVH